MAADGEAMDPEDAPAADEGPSHGRRRFLGLAGGAAVLAGAAAVGGWELTRPAPTRVRAEAPTSSTTTSTAPKSKTHALQVTTETLPPLPIPEALPDPNAPAPAAALGTIAIPRLGLNVALQEGMMLAAINRGPAHWPGTALPGQLGNVVIAGHRTTYTEPFRHLERLQPGDPVFFVVGGIASAYVTRGVVIVPANAIDIAAQSYAHTATLFACHPPGEATERIVAKLRLVGTGGVPADPDTALPPLDEGSQAGGHSLTVQADPLNQATS
jgi:sortase A